MPLHLTDGFRLLLDASWQSSLIIGLILLVRPLMGASVPARWRHLLWLLVLVRLLVPVTLFPPSPVSLQNLSVMEAPDRQVQRALRGVPVPAPEAMAEAAPADLPAMSSVAPGPVPSLPSATRHGIPWQTSAAAVWFGGVIAMLLFMGLAQLRLRRRIVATSRPPAEAVLREWDRCCDALRIGRRPMLSETACVRSPALVGFFPPRLLLPAETPGSFSPEDWKHVFIHELAHYRRGDHWVHALQLLALALHWFNPLVWLGFRQMRADRELAADEWALRRLDPAGSTGYGETLLKVLAQPSGGAAGFGTVGILENRLQLRQRLQRIAAFGPRTLLGSLLGAGIVIVLAVVVIGRRAERADASLYGSLTPEQRMVVAAMDGDTAMLKQLIRQGTDLNTVVQIERGRTPLMGAAWAHQMKALRLLIASGADVKRQVNNSENPLMSALQSGWSDSAEFLLKKGAVCEPVMLAAARGDLAAVQPLIDKQPPDLNRLKLLSRISAVNDRPEIFARVMEKIRSLPGQNYWELDCNSIEAAVALGRRDIIQQVIDGGCDLNKGTVLRLSGAAAQSPGMRQWLIGKGFDVPEYTPGEQLIEASEREDVPEMTRLLADGVDVNFRGEDGWTPLTKAAAWNRANSMRFLLDHHADPNVGKGLGPDKWSVLSLTGMKNMSDMLLAAGAKVQGQQPGADDGQLGYAVGIGMTDKVKWYLDQGVDPKKVDSYGRTLLFSAGNPDVAELLISHGVDVRARGKEGWTALHMVCMFGERSADIVRVLLKHGADANARDDRGFTPLMYARNGATVDALVEGGADPKAKTNEGLGLFEVVGHGADASLIDALIRHGVPFDLKTDGPTLLVRAAWSNQINLLNGLLDRGVDPNLKGCWNKKYNDYMTPLQAAVTDGQFDAAKLLVEHGARPDGEMRNALHNRRTAIVKLFWDHGVRNISELTYAISQGRPVGELQALLDQDAPVEPPQDKPVTPLGEAALLGNLDAVKLLAERGADINGGSALPQAAGEGQDEIVAFLIQHGAKPDYQTLWNAVWNCNPYANQRSKEHFEKTLQLLVEAGGMKALSDQEKAQLLQAAIFSRNPSGNIAVVKCLLDQGASLDIPDSKGQTVRQMVKEACKETTCSTPTKEMAAFLE